MFQYQCLNPISKVGLDGFTNDYTKTEEIEKADAILVRSASMHEMKLPENIQAIARAGAGVNNIPLQDCAEQGIVVFNTPGANANGVKEMVIAGMLLASRDIVGGVEWVKQEKDNSVSSVWEPSEPWLPTLRFILVWKYTDMIHIFL